MMAETNKHLQLQSIQLSLSYLPGIHVHETTDGLSVDLRDGTYRVRHNPDENAFIVICPPGSTAQHRTIAASKATTVVAFLYERNRSLLWMAISNWLLDTPHNNAARAVLRYLINGGGDVDQDAHPADIDDFRACLDLFRALPEFDAKRDILKMIDPIWSAIFDEWEDLSNLYFEEIDQGKPAAPLTYDALKRAIGKGYKDHPDYIVQMNERGHVLSISRVDVNEAIS